MSDIITLNHGSGGKQAHDLIMNLFVKRFEMIQPLSDSAVLMEQGCIFAFTTDSYVVDPLFFPGGNIGKLAVCGTVNDLSVSGAVPKYISASFIIEEGFPVKDLEAVVGSMAEEAGRAGVKIVTGDTKVVGKGKCDKLFITTAGTGFIKPGFEHISTGKKIRPGDIVIGMASTGLHTNGFSLARKLFFDELQLKPTKHIDDLGCTVVEAHALTHSGHPCVIGKIDL